MHVSYSTVQRLYSYVKDSLPKRPGWHPRQLIANDQFPLAQRVTSDTGPQLKRVSDLNVTLQTVINTLRKAGLKTAIEKKRPLLSRAHWQGSPGAPTLDPGGLGQGELVT